MILRLKYKNVALKEWIFAVATGGFGGASDRLHLTQTAISAKILVEEQVAISGFWTYG